MKVRISAAAVSITRAGVLLASVLIASALVQACQQGPRRIQTTQPLSNSNLDPQQWYDIDPGIVRRKPQFSESDLRSYVQAGLVALEIDARWNRRIRSVNDLDVARKLRRQAQAEMARAVKDAGMSVQKYSRINDAERINPQLRERVMRYRKEARKIFRSLPTSRRPRR